MIRLRNAILAVVASLFATGALAQVGFMQDSETATVAEELFGGGAVKLEFGAADFAPKAKLIFGGGETIADATEFDVTLTLHNATFAEPVSNADFMWGGWGAASTARGGLDCNTDTTGNEGDAGVAAGTGDDATKLVFCPETSQVTIERDGGGKNTNSVTFTVTANAAIENIASPTRTDGADDGTDVSDADPYNANVTRKIVFVLPDINASGLVAANEDGKGGKDVMASWTIMQTKSGGTVIREAVTNPNACGGADAGKTPVHCTLVDAVAVVEAISATAGSGYISLTPTDERSVLVGSNGKASDPQRALLATVSVDVATGFGGAKDQDGDPITGFTGDLSGSLAIRVSSDSFNDGDVVYIDSNSNGKVDGREAFDMEDGVASDTVPLGTSSMSIYYVPSGDDALTHRTTFTTTANTEFADTDAKQRSAKPAMAMLKLFGIQDGVAKAYAIAPTTSMDQANLRVTCESSGKAGCNVFLDCHDAAGMNMFGEAGMMIGPNATGHLNQMDIEDALGMDESWTGRLSCDVLSSAPISVQVLTRAAGVLVNNTSVNEGGN